jgi:hypothetical protein
MDNYKNGIHVPYVTYMIRSVAYHSTDFILPMLI